MWIRRTQEMTTFFTRFPSHPEEYRAVVILTCLLGGLVLLWLGISVGIAWKHCKKLSG